ncbi:MAG: polysaccharide biosynthesis protein [Clostridia bacterium]|nr:polysaccharide biosynthesis protein [Clostridia bacterium]
MKKTIFIKNAAILTASALILRFIGIIFKVWLTTKIGQEGIGLYQLVFSVYVLASTFATSGISTAVTKLCTEELTFGNKDGIKNILKKAIWITLIIAFLTVGILFFGADFISAKFLSTAKASISLRVLSISLPFMGLCSCFRGYFLARRKATPPALSQILEQIIRIISVFIGIKMTVGKGIDITCAAVMLGDTAAEISSCLYLYILFVFDKRKVKDRKDTYILKKEINAKIKEIALPITLGRYLNSGLRTIENILVPKKLKVFGNSAEKALAQFGMIKGMALPILFFPSTLLNSVSTLLIPELTEAGSKNQIGRVKYAVKKVLITTAICSYIISALFFVCGKNIGMLIYKDKTVGWLIKVLSPIIPFMYLDSISDGMLKGLNQQKFTFKTGIGDSSIRIFLIILLVPKFGIRGFVGIMYFSNAFTGILNVGRLLETGHIKIEFIKYVITPFALAFTIVLILETVLKAIPNISNLVYIISMFTFSTAIYAFLIKKMLDVDIHQLL